MKKEDFLLAAVLLMATCFIPFILIRSLSPYSLADTVQIYSDGQVFGTYSLFEDRTIAVSCDSGSNIVSIAGGKVFVSEADCPGNDCVRCGEISKAGEFIVCIPHRLYILITSGTSENVPDGVTY